MNVLPHPEFCVVSGIHAVPLKRSMIGAGTDFVPRSTMVSSTFARAQRRPGRVHRGELVDVALDGPVGRLHRRRRDRSDADRHGGGVVERAALHEELRLRRRLARVDLGCPETVSCVAGYVVAAPFAAGWLASVTYGSAMQLPS